MLFLLQLSFIPILRDDEMDYYDSRCSLRHSEEDLEVETRAEKHIINAKKGQKDIPRKSSLPVDKSSRHSVSESERKEPEYESDGEEEENSSPHKRFEESEQEYDEEEPDEEEADVNGASEEEAEEPHQKGWSFGGSIKRKGIESDEDSPPRKFAGHRWKAVVFDSDED